MPAIQCSTCGSKISEKALFCPECGHPNNESNIMTLKKIILFSFMCFVVLWIFFYLGFEKVAHMDIPLLDQQAAMKSWKNDGDIAYTPLIEYEIAKRHGDLKQICIQAGFVCEAYHQANDEINYRRWKRIESEDCKQAGF